MVYYLLHKCKPLPLRCDLRNKTGMYRNRLAQLVLLDIAKCYRSDCVTLVVKVVHKQ